MPKIPDDMEQCRIYTAKMQAEENDRKTFFEGLRKRRNDAWNETVSDLAKQLSIDPAELVSNYIPDACYCDCGSIQAHETGERLCEHNFQGSFEYEGGSVVSSRCTRCHLPAYSHDMMSRP